MRRADLGNQYNAVEILERNLPARGSEIALVTPGGSQTFADVADQVAQVATGLRRVGLGVGDHVGILCLDGPAWAITFFAAIKCGAVAAPFNTAMTSAELAHVLNDSGARVLVVDHTLLAVARTACAATVTLVVVGGAARAGELAFSEVVKKSGPVIDTTPTHPDDPCCLNYSSGTTGPPKGIHHTHADLLISTALVGQNVFDLTPADRTYAVARLFFTYGTGGNLLFPWAGGASVVLVPESPREARVVEQILNLYRPTVLFNVPTGYASLLAIPEFPAVSTISSLRLCVSAGEALPAPLWQRWKERTGLEILDGLGNTEAFHIFICNRVGAVRPGSSGKPVAGYDVKIVDGQLWVRGETTAHEYFQRPTQTALTFQDGWVATGDRYRMDDDGYFIFEGRTDDMLKVGGLWLSPLEVETALMCHPAVSHCAVVGHPDDAGLTKPRAFVVLHPGNIGSDELAQELMDFCKGKLAAYKRPRHVEFVSDLPVTSTGKIQRFRLRPP